jgi:shikimate dehydrogenase
MISGRTRVFAILGHPVAHSLSPVMHNAAFHALGLDAVYVALECAPGGVADAMRLLASAGGGGNVTVPHKTEAAAALSRPSALAASLEAANTFWADGDELAGDNTDVAGILAALQSLDAPRGPWLVAGTGGGARAVAASAVERGAGLAVRSRSEQRRAEFESWAAGIGVLRADARDCRVLINATPLGLKEGDHLPLSTAEAPEAEVALDLVYARQQTMWIRSMRAEGLRAADGRSMLVAQGAAAFRHWFPAEDAPVEIMRAAVEDALH